MNHRMHRDSRGWPGVFVAAAVVTGCASAVPADEMVTRLAAVGDPVRGREVFVGREGGHCVICHKVPGAEGGDFGPSLGGVGARFNAAQLRQRVADITRVKPDAMMPSFHRTEGLKRVASAHAGKPVLSAQQVEDVEAFLGTMK
jgi:sulfur-oxidizing protein SoxX